MKSYYLDDGLKIQIDDSKAIGSGGEGSVYSLSNDKNILVKIYNKRAISRMSDIEDKIKAMVNQKPGLLGYKGLTIIAWPQRVVYDDLGQFAGYVMSKVGAKNNLSHVIIPGLQKKKFPHITWYDRLVIAINLSLVMSYVHKNNCVIGDINTSDFFVYPGFEIGVVDTDSFQVIENNRVFHCSVFTPDYTPPEVIRAKKGSKEDILRIADNDNYGLAVLIFQILMMGVHPFSARIKNVHGFDGNAINFCMEKEIFPYSNSTESVIPPKNALPYAFFPKEIQNMFISSFRKYDGFASRPTADEWVDALRVLKDNIVKCKRNKEHYYSKHFKKCPHCVKEKTKDYDYLLKHFETISSKFVTYYSSGKKVVVDEGHIIDGYISGSLYSLRNPKYQFVRVHENILKQMDVEKRLEELIGLKVYQKLKNYFIFPEKFVYDKAEFIGYTFKKTEKLYRLTTFLKSNKLGKIKITEKVKVTVAKNIAKMFMKFEKYEINCELSQIYLDKEMHPHIPDLVFFGNPQGDLKRTVFSREDYLPQEYYMMEEYLQYLEKVQKEEEIKENERLVEEEKKLKPSVAFVLPEVKPKTSLADFSFETSINPLPHEKVIKEQIPPKITEYNSSDANSIRFNLAVIIHQVISGSHPFNGLYNSSKQTSSFFIKKNLYLHERQCDVADITDKAKLVEEFPVYMQKINKKAFYIDNPNKIKRPTAKEWKKALDKFGNDLKRCSHNDYHYYYKAFIKCPICYRAEKKDNEEVRVFCHEHKKRLLDNIVLINMNTNKVILSAVLLFFIYLINSDNLSMVQNMYGSIDLDSKITQFLSLIKIDVILVQLKGIINTVAGWVSFVFGG